MSVQKLARRETEIVNLSELDAEIKHPEGLRIKFSDEVRKASIDIGSLAYTIRVEPSWQELVAGSPTLVDLGSMLECRRELIRGVVDAFVTSGARERSILFSCKNFRYVLDWCDANSFCDVFESPNSTRRAFVAYNDYLRQMMLVDKALKPQTCAGRQSFFVHLIQIMFGNETMHIIHGLPSIRAGARQASESPREQDVQLYVRVCLDVARRFSEFVLTNGSFPFEAVCAGVRVVCFPSMQGMLTPLNASSREHLVYNYEGCRLLTVDEYIAKSGFFESVCRRGLAAAQGTIDQSNADQRHQQRFRLAALAANSYVCIFAILTGASPTELGQFDYEDALEIEKSLVKREFDSVKFRANGRKTRYALGRGVGLQLLKEYLRIRSWLLDGKYFPQLFFSVERKGGYTGAVKRLSPTFSQEFYDRVSGVFLAEGANNIRPSLCRKYKSLVLHELKVKPGVIAEALNHTTATNQSSYIETTVDRYEQEFSTFWRAIRRAKELVKERARAEDSSIPVGHCESIESPRPISENVPIQPNCKSQYGCLYCENYICHADEEDVHKIASLQYVIQAVRDLTPDYKHAESLFKELSLRIEAILREIRETSESAARMVDDVKHRVLELGELTPFWEARLQRYEVMGVVF